MSRARIPRPGASLALLLLASCGAPPGETSALRLALTAPRVLYLNFDGATITKSSKTSDATTNTSFLGGGTLAPYPGDATARGKVASLVAQAFKPYNVKVVTARPATGDYQMGVIGGYASNLGIGTTAGISPLDCGDANGRDIFFVFAAHMAAKSTLMLAERVSQSTAHEAGHSFGLPHSNDPCDLMVSPFDAVCPAGFFRSFLDKAMSCVDLSCGPSTTNSHQQLLKNLGPAQASPPPPPPPAPDAAPAKDHGASPDRARDRGAPAPALDAGTPPPPPPPTTPPPPPPATTPETPASPELGEAEGPSVLEGGCALGGADLPELPLALLVLLLFAARAAREDPTVRDYVAPSEEEPTTVDEAPTRKLARGRLAAPPEPLPSDELGLDRPLFERRRPRQRSFASRESCFTSKEVSGAQTSPCQSSAPAGRRRLCAATRTAEVL